MNLPPLRSVRIYVYAQSMRKTDWGKGVIELKRTSLMLPEKLWRNVKIRALHENRNAQEIVAEALEEYLRRAKKGGTADGGEG